MTTIIFAFLLLLLASLGLLLFRESKTTKKRVPGTRYTNRKGDNWIINERHGLERTGSLKDFLDHPNVRKDLKAMGRLFMQQTLMALYEGKRPPHSVGKYGTLTKKKLMIEWNDEWQAELDKMSEYYDVTYNSFFGIPEDHPPVQVLLTAEEILAEYGREKEKG